MSGLTRCASATTVGMEAHSKLLEAKGNSSRSRQQAEAEIFLTNNAICGYSSFEMDTGQLTYLTPPNPISYHPS